MKSLVQCQKYAEYINIILFCYLVDILEITLVLSVVLEQAMWMFLMPLNNNNT
jgi:hypothetical protein